MWVGLNVRNDVTSQTLAVSRCSSGGFEESFPHHHHYVELGKPTFAER